MKRSIITQFVKNPKTTGAIAPSSSFLSKKIISGLNFKDAQTIVELGPGTGAITAFIEKELNEHNKFFGIELNEDIYHFVSNRFPNQKFYLDSASNLPKILKKENLDLVDIIISGLPWAAFHDELQDSILDAILESLKEGGIFTTFAYLHGSILPAAKSFKQKLHKYFSHVEKSNIVWRNIPPAYVYKCHK